MERLADLVTQIKTPLILGGFVVLVLAWLVYRVILPKRSRSASRERRKVAEKVLQAFFILAVLAIVLGFASYIFVAALGENGNLEEDDVTPSAPAETPASTQEDILAVKDAPVTLNLYNKNVVDVLQACAQDAGVTLALDPELKNFVVKRIEVEKSKLSDILDNICYKKCRWEIRHNENKVVLYVGPLAHE
jgi:hypothetical protein